MSGNCEIVDTSHISQVIVVVQSVQLICIDTKTTLYIIIILIPRMCGPLFFVHALIIFSLIFS
jgi:hypothetical protein